MLPPAAPDVADVVVGVAPDEVALPEVASEALPEVVPLPGSRLETRSVAEERMPPAPPEARLLAPAMALEMMLPWARTVVARPRTTTEYFMMV